MQAFAIGNHLFLAPTALDAAYEAIALARTLFQAGERHAARALHEEAINIRRIETAGYRPRPQARPSIRPRRSRR